MILAMPPGALTRDELIGLVERIMRVETADEDDEDRLVDLFEESVVHPAASDLIFHPARYFGEGHEPSAEEVVDAALAYRPIELGPSG
jgi:Colicin immunity protein / pyocin immunity protein